jgi:DNA-binding MarR family transcriptional regulator
MFLIGYKKSMDRRILEAVREGYRMSRTIANHLGLVQAHVSTSLSSLHRRGYVCRSAVRGSASEYYYRLPPESPR